MLRLLRYLKAYWWQIIVLLISVSVTVWTTLQLPNLMANIINDGIVSGDINIIWQNGIEMLVITIIGGAATVLSGFLSARIGTGIGRTLRSDVFNKIEDFSLSEINKFSTASLITRSTNDIQQIQIVMVMLLTIGLRFPLMAVWAVIQAAGNAPNMTWIIGLAVVVLLSIVIVLIAIAMPKFTLLQKAVDKLNLVARENLTGLRVVRAFNNEKVEEEKFDRANKDLAGLYLFVNKVMIIMMPTMQLIFSLTTLLIIWVGAHFVELGDLQIGNMMAFIQYATQVIMSFLMIAMVFVMVPRANVSAQRVNEVLRTKNSIVEPKRAAKFNNDGTVQFKDVTFCYPDAEEPVLQSISFTAKPGQTTAFIGSTGSGKSTLINLVPRFFDATGGEVLIGGQNIKKLTHEQIATGIGYVPQKSVLFSGTINSNMKFGNDKATQAQIKKAINVAQASKFVDGFAEGREHEISQGGKNVSGGQKQRLSIARAIVRDPKIYIFDDSFSALDFKTDANLRKALKPITKKSTVLIVAQRINTIKDADQIIVLDEGKIVGRGSHRELLKKCPTYREIAQSQFSDDEIKRELAGGKNG
ncbi:MAG: ABC transporter ATP-binding protein/permease [Candidatus Nomurabacteria bacterium]|jgi:ATP-binding cassette subfamily B protein|nr:ABC transporter ATP-binding protein/permease [Candidatus Nomurabacteria bacterium]